MQNPVYSMVSEALARVVSERAADHMLRAALKDARLSPDQVTAEEMQKVLAGPLTERLATVMPPNRARQELSVLASRIQSMYPKAPTLFPEMGNISWDTPASRTPPAPAVPAPEPAPVSPAAADTSEFDAGFIDFDLDEFEFDDPEEASRPPLVMREYDLRGVSGQDELLSDLARFEGVQGVLLCDASGRVVRSRIARGADALGAVMAATAALFRNRPWRIMCADLGTQVVCVRPLGGHFVALLTSSNTNLGRLIGELSVLKESA